MNAKRFDPRQKSTFWSSLGVALRPPLGGKEFNMLRKENHKLFILKAQEFASRHRGVCMPFCKFSLLHGGTATGAKFKFCNLEYKILTTKEALMIFLVLCHENEYLEVKVKIPWSE